MSCGGGGGDDPPDTGRPPPPPAAGSAVLEHHREHGHRVRARHRQSRPTRRRRCSAAASRPATTTATATWTSTSCAATSGRTCCTATMADNHFTDVAAAAGVDHAAPGGGGYLHSGPAFADVDGDGDLDLFVGGMEGDPCLLYENDGDGTFTDVTDASGFKTMGANEHDLRVVRRLRPRRRPRHDAGALGHAASARRLRRATATPSRCGATTATRTGSASPTSASSRASPRRSSRGAAAITSSSRTRSTTTTRFTPAFARMDADRYPDILSVADFSNSRVFMSNGENAGIVTFRDATDNDVHHRPQRHGRCGRRHRQRRRPRLVRHRDLRLQRDGRQPALPERRLGRAGGRDGGRRRRGRRLGLGRLLRGFQPRRPARHLPHQRLGVEPDRRLRERSQPAVHRRRPSGLQIRRRGRARAA